MDETYGGDDLDDIMAEARALASPTAGIEFSLQPRLAVRVPAGDRLLVARELFLLLTALLVIAGFTVH